MNNDNNYNQNNMNQPQYNNYNQNNMNQPQYNNGTYKLILNRQKNFVASLVAFKVYVDDNLVGKIKNGKSLIVDITPGPHVITINKSNATNIMVNGDVTADVVVFGANNFGLTNINGSGMNQNYVDNNQNNLSSKYVSMANGLLITSIVVPVLSVILFFVTDKKYILQYWFYSIVVGMGFVNIFGLKNIKQYDSKVYQESLIKNVVAIIISTVAIFITIYLLNFK